MLPGEQARQAFEIVAGGAHGARCPAPDQRLVHFEFGGEPPFEFTYTRSSNTDKKGKNSRGVVLDMRSEISDEHSMRIAAHEEGTYEVVAIKDRYCAYSRPGVKVGEKSGQKKLGYY